MSKTGGPVKLLNEKLRSQERTRALGAYKRHATQSVQDGSAPQRRDGGAKNIVASNEKAKNREFLRKLLETHDIPVLLLHSVKPVDKYTFTSVIGTTSVVNRLQVVQEKHSNLGFYRNKHSLIYDILSEE